MASNYRLIATRIAVACAMGEFFISPAYAAKTVDTPVLTRSYENSRAGANVLEPSLTPSAVARGMRRLFSLVVTDDPRIEAQPLIVPNQRMSDGRVHNVAYVATMGNHLYAFDADDGSSIWKQPASFGPAFHPPVTSTPLEHRSTTIDAYGINIRWGILSTPVVDIDRRVMYIVNWVAENGDRDLYLHEVALSDGHHLRPPIALTASFTLPSGKTVTLGSDQTQRAALLLDPLRLPAGSSKRKHLIITMAGGENPGAPRGWMLAYDVPSLSQLGSWVSTPNSFGGGMWASGQGPSADQSGDVYAMTANGGFTVDHGAIQDYSGTTDFPESFVKLRVVGDAQGRTSLRLIDWYSPFIDAKRTTFANDYDYKDQDLGASAPIVPDGTNLVIGSGKDGVLYVLRRDHFGMSVGASGGLVAPPAYFTFPGADGVPPTGDLDFPLPVKTHHDHGSPVFWRSRDLGPMLFVWGENESLRAYRFDTTSGVTTLFGRGAAVASADLADPANKTRGGMPGGMLTLSANGDLAGIVWATAPANGDANKQIVEGVFRAYDATRTDGSNADGSPRLRLLWSSESLSDVNFLFAKFTPPVVSGGKVYVPTYDGRIDVYGLQ